MERVFGQRKAAIFFGKDSKRTDLPLPGGGLIAESNEKSTLIERRGFGIVPDSFSIALFFISSAF